MAPVSPDASPATDSGPSTTLGRRVVALLTRRLAVATLERSRESPTRGARHVSTPTPPEPARPAAPARRALERLPPLARDRRLVRVRRDRRRTRGPGPDQADHRRRLPAPRGVGPSGRPGGGRSRFPDDQVESVLVTSRDGGRLDPVGRTPVGPRDRHRDVRCAEASPKVTAPASGTASAARASWSTSTSRARIDDAQQIQARTAAIARAHQELRVREAGDLSVNTAINDRVGRGPPLGGGDQPPGHPAADAARLRRPDRCRRPRPAGSHLGRGHDGHRRAPVAPDPRRADRDQHDRADRDGGRRRLLAVLPQARARGAAPPRSAARSTPSRSRRPRRVTRSWCRAGP